LAAFEVITEDANVVKIDLVLPVERTALHTEF
jgi:hypothetical protein